MMMLFDDKQIKNVDKTKIEGLSPVGLSNSYNDLDNLPTSFKTENHSHNNATVSKAGFMSHEDKVKMTSNQFINMRIQSGAVDKTIYPTSFNGSVSIEAGDNIVLSTEIVDNKFIINAQIKDAAKGPKGDTGHKGQDGDIWKPSIDYTCNLSLEKNPNMTSPDSIYILGDKGPIGDKGSVGIKGLIGKQGPQGPQGIVGETGDKGPIGDKGEQGPQGPQGIAGIEGDKGPIGDQGPVGDKGPIGDQGPVGEEGPRGPFEDITNKPSGDSGTIWTINNDNESGIDLRYIFETVNLAENKTDIDTFNAGGYEYYSVNTGYKYSGSTKISGNLFEDFNFGKFLYSNVNGKLFFLKDSETIIPIKLKK